MANIGLIYLVIGFIFAFLMNFIVLRKSRVSFVMDMLSLLIITLFWFPILAASLYTSIKRSLNE